MARYSTVPVADLAVVLAITPDLAASGWLQEVRWKEPPRDADGAVIENCVFADETTGLVVVEDPAPPEGRHPLRCVNRKGPLTVKVKPAKPGKPEEPPE